MSEKRYRVQLNKVNLGKLNVKKLQNSRQHLKEKNHREGPPGLLAYSGKFVNEPFHGEIITYDRDYYDKVSFSTLGEVMEALTEHKETQQIMWINLSGLANTRNIEQIGHFLNIPELFLEDMVHISKHSKYNIGHHIIFNVLQMIYMRGEKVAHENVSIVFKERLILTIQETEGDVFDGVRHRIEQHKGFVRDMSTDYLYYSLVDTVIDHYIEVVQYLTLRTDDLEEVIVDGETIDLNDIYRIKKQLLNLKTSLFPITNLVNDIKNGSVESITSEVYPFLGDLEEHIQQVSGDVGNMREMINHLFETNMLNVSNDMNEVMTTLTIFSAIFIPLSFLAGVFGMNFKYMPGMDSPYGFYIFIGICFIVAVSMIGFFKKNKWF